MGAEEYLVSNGSSKDDAPDTDEAILPGTPLSPRSMDTADDADDYDRRAPDVGETGGEDGADVDGGGGGGAEGGEEGGGETPAKPKRKPRARRASVQQWAQTRQQSGASTQHDLTDDPVADAARARARSESRNSAVGRGIRPPPDAKITGPNQAAWECFKRIDTDASGLLDEAEVSALVKEMRIPGASSAKLIKQLREMDTQDPDGQISFREFSIWWNRHREVERRRARRDVKELFDLVDDDGSGLLDKEELADFVKKAQKFKSLKDVIEGDRPFELEKDWKLMRRGAPGGLQGVSFLMFESWWKDRAGISDQDIVVLPEFISQRLTEGNGQLLHFHTGESLGDAEVDIDDSNWAPRTIWVGSVPRGHANKGKTLKKTKQIEKHTF